MNTNSVENLIQEELLQLALDASRNGNVHAAIAYFEKAISREDTTAVAHYLLGAEYAQIQKYDAAVAQMGAAIALDPSLNIARFQLGLLWITQGNGANAQLILAPLEEVPADNPLHHFGKGLIYLTQDQFPECVQHLKQGIELNTENLPLNNDMQRILDEIAKMDAHSTAVETQKEAEESDAQHIFLSAYTDKNGH